ncbi:MAG TPA: M48 family metalloprotease [Candidatus Omnitrophota bacterium]|nr:M48 family metalloprotease [Candidatus Omnitrophota bacterium]
MRLSRRQTLSGLLAGIALPTLSGCQMAPGTGRESFNLLSADDEAKMGREAHPQIMKEFGGAYDDPALQAYVAGIGQRLVRASETPAAEYRFTVLNSDIVNAMALPGGYVYITRGLLALNGNEAELAGVLGHEIGHITARHSAQRYSRAMAANLGVGLLGAVLGTPGVADIAQMGAAYWLSSYSQENEFEADSLGVRYVSRSGWHADAMATMLTKLREHSRLEAVMAGRSPDSVDEHHFMSTHPRTVDRVQAAVKQSLGAPAQGQWGEAAFLDRVDGMVWGDDPKQGIIRGRSFLHPDLGLRFDVPAGFRLVNSDRAVMARNQAGAVILFDGGAARGAGDMLAYMQRTWLPKVQLANGERIEINGMPAATATARGRTKQGQVDLRFVAVRFDGDSVYRFTFATPPNQTAALGEDLRRTTYSLRPLSAEERAGIRPLRVKVVTVKAGDTAEALGGRMAMDSHRVEQFRLINGLDAGEQPRAGSRVKLVV